MININLNASEDWERVRRDTEPTTPDVDRNPGTEDADRPELENGTHGLRIVRRRRGKQDEQNQPDEENREETEENEAYEVDIGEGEHGFGPPPDGERAPLEPYQAQHVDIEA